HSRRSRWDRATGVLRSCALWIQGPEPAQQLFLAPAARIAVTPPLSLPSFFLVVPAPRPRCSRPLLSFRGRGAPSQARSPAQKLFLARAARIAVTLPLCLPSFFLVVPVHRPHCSRTLLSFRGRGVPSQARSPALRCDCVLPRKIAARRLSWLPAFARTVLPPHSPCSMMSSSYQSRAAPPPVHLLTPRYAPAPFAAAVQMI